MFKKLLCVFLSASLLACIPASAAQLQQAVEAIPEAPKLTSVVTHEKITHLDQLLKLAMEQYEEKVESEPQVAAYSAHSEKESEEIVASQVLREERYSDGSIVRQVSNTALLVLDEMNQKISADDYEAYYHQTSGSWSGGIYGSLEFCVNEMIGDAPTVQGIYVKAATGYGGPNRTTMIRTQYYVTDQFAYQPCNETKDFSSPRPAQVCQMSINYRGWVQLNNVRGTFARAQAYFYNNYGTVVEDEHNPEYFLMIDDWDYYKKPY